MSDAAAPEVTGACAKCGGDLHGARYERSVTCAYCREAQPNRACLAPGDEVLHASQVGGYYTLARVAACAGPDGIEIEHPNAPATRKTMRLEDVVPVVRATDALAKGTSIFNSAGGFGWQRTWTASAVARGQLKVKHADAAFQSSFFDTSTDLANVRVPAGPADRHTRTAAQGFLDNVKADPLGAGVSIVIKLVFAVFALFFLFIAVSIAWSCLRSP